MNSTFRARATCARFGWSSDCVPKFETWWSRNGHRIWSVQWMPRTAAAPRPGQRTRLRCISSRICEADPVTVPPNPFIVDDLMIMLPALTNPRSWRRSTNQFKLIATNCVSVDWMDRSYSTIEVHVLRRALRFGFRIENPEYPSRITNAMPYLH